MPNFNASYDLGGVWHFGRGGDSDLDPNYGWEAVVIFVENFHNMSSRIKNFFYMTNQISDPVDQIRPDDLIAELGIKKDTYYADLKHLGIKASKDENGKAYLTNEQANLVRALRSYVNETGKREGFTSDITDDIKGDLVHSQNGQELSNSYQEAQEVDLEFTEPAYTSGKGFDDNDLERLIEEAAHLKMQNLAAPHLIKLHLAEQMTEEDLPPQMREKVVAVREAANPKFQAATVASGLLTQWRNRGGNS